MEVIKRTIKQALTTGTTETCNGKCRRIIPDLNAVYSMNILLTAKAIDFGIFEYIDDISGYGYSYYGFNSEPIGLNNLT